MHEMLHDARMSTHPAGDAWVPSDAEFGARLALVRHACKWNVKEAALACGLNAQSWRDWEIHGRSPRNVAEVAAQIAARTGVDDYWLMTGRKNPRQGGPGGGGLPRLDSNQQPSGERIAQVTRLEDRRPGARDEALIPSAA